MKLHIGQWPASSLVEGRPAYWHVMVEVSPGRFLNQQASWPVDYAPTAVDVCDVGDQVDMGWIANDDGS